MKFSKNHYCYIISGVFILCGILFTVKGPDTLREIIKVDLEKRIFAGSFPALLFLLGAAFAWLGFRETKEDVLARARKSLEDSSNVLKDATDAIEGKKSTIHFRLGPDEMVPVFKKLSSLGRLKGKYVLKRSGATLKEGELTLFTEAVSKAIMADVKDVPMDPNTLLELTLEDDSKVWRASESVRVRIVNMKEHGD